MRRQRLADYLAQEALSHLIAHLDALDAQLAALDAPAGASYEPAARLASGSSSRRRVSGSEMWFGCYVRARRAPCAGAWINRGRIFYTAWSGGACQPRGRRARRARGR